MADNKDKKVLNVPALRFPEFTEEWEEHYLAEYLDFKNGLNPSANKFGSGIKFISVMDILNNDFITYDCIRTSVEITPEEQVAFAVEKGDMLFQRSSETLEDVGRANVYMDDRPAVFGGFVIRGKKKAEYNPMFFRYLLASPYARKKVIPMGAGAQHFNIGQDGLSKVKLHFPILQEQLKIADLLRLINERISTQNKIIEDLKKLKSAISKQVFAQEPNGWSRLDTLFSKGKAGGTPTSTNKEYYNGEIPFLSINDITKQGKYVRYTENHLSQSGLENSSAWVVPKYSLIMLMYASVGLVTINEIPITTSQAMFAMQLKDKDLLDYLYYYLGQFTRNYTQTVKRAADNKRRYAPGWVHSTCLLRGFPKGAAPHLAHDFAEQSVVCYTLCRRCPENTVAAGEGKGI